MSLTHPETATPETNVSLRIVHFTEQQNLHEALSRQKLTRESNVAVQIPAGSNRDLNLQAVESLVAMMRGTRPACPVRVLVRVDREEIRRLQPKGESDVSSMSEFPLRILNSRTYQDRVLDLFPALQTLRSIEGVTCVPVVQERIDSEIEAERAVHPTDDERHLFDGVTDLTIVGHTGSLARRQGIGVKTGLAHKDALPLKQVSLYAQAEMPVGNPVTENITEGASLYVAQAADALNAKWLFNLARRVARDVKGAISSAGLKSSEK